MNLNIPDHLKVDAITVTYERRSRSIERDGNWFRCPVYDLESEFLEDLLVAVGAAMQAEHQRSEAGKGLDVAFTDRLETLRKSLLP